jgi:hypothetical protein
MNSSRYLVIAAVVAVGMFSACDSGGSVDTGPSGDVNAPTTDQQEGTNNTGSYAGSRQDGTTDISVATTEPVTQ